MKGLKVLLLCVSIVVLGGDSRADERVIDTIIIHHTASSDVSAEIIDGWHKARGWNEIGYHYVIRRDGSIEKGRPDWKQGAHAKGRNKTSIGIALCAYSRFKPIQAEVLGDLIADLSLQYPIKAIERHHEQCPSEGLDVEDYNRFIESTEEYKNICIKKGVDF